ncbi:MAG: type II secretion system F family protein [Acidobacteriota bacterium]
MATSSAFQQLRASQVRGAKIDVNLKLKDEELLTFTESCRDLYEAGVPINEILRQLQQATPNKRFALAIGLMVDDIENGKVLSQALERFPNAFGEDYRALIQAAEGSGKWTRRWNRQGELRDGILEMLIRYIKRRNSARERVKSGLIYPAMIGLAVIAALSIFAFYILPTLKIFFASLDTGGEKWILTRALFGVGDFITNYWWAIPIAAIAVILLSWYYFTSPEGRALWAKYQLRIKKIGPLFVKMNVGETMWLMGTLFSAGLTPQAVFDIVIQTARNPEIAQALRQAKEYLFQGISFCETLKKSHWAFDGHTYMVISTSQKSGRLGTALQNYAEQLFERVDRDLDRMVKMLEPILLIAAGVVVGLIVIAFYGTLSSAIGRVK